MRYMVVVADNAHYMDASEHSSRGAFETAHEALALAQSIVDDDLRALYRDGMSDEELYRHYTTFGSDPFIVCSDESCRFSAWSYARQRASDICGSS
jgi:hypothetical protein